MPDRASCPLLSHALSARPVTRPVPGRRVGSARAPRPYGDQPPAACTPSVRPRLRARTARRAPRSRPRPPHPRRARRAEEPVGIEVVLRRGRRCRRRARAGWRCPTPRGRRCRRSACSAESSRTRRCAPRARARRRRRTATGWRRRGAVEHRPADVAVVGHVERPPAPRLPEVDRQHHVGPVATDRRGQVAPQRHAVLDEAVDVTLEELDRFDADDPRAGVLLGLAHLRGLVGRHAVDAGLTARHEQVGHPLAGRGPLRDRARHAVLEVVGVRDDAERARPGLGERLHASGRRRSGRRYIMCAWPKTSRTRGSKCSSGSVW